MNSDTGGQSTSDVQRRTAAEIARRRVLAAYTDRAQQSAATSAAFNGGSQAPQVAASEVSGSPRRAIYSAPSATDARSTAASQKTSTSGTPNPLSTASSALPNVAASQANTTASAPQPPHLTATDRSTTSPYAAPNQSHLKDEPISPAINSESWRRYHSAWQDYYQKYYNDYYSNAARNYIAKERLKDAREQAEVDEAISSLSSLSRSARTKRSNQSGLDINTPAASGIPGRVDRIRQRLRLNVRERATDSAKKSRRFRKFIPIVAGATVVLVILFLQYNRLIFAPIMAYVSPGNAPASEIEALDPTITQTVSADPRLIIPKLNIDVPITFGVPLSDVMEAMNYGVAHYRISGASAYPGQIGNFIITGHSAGDIYQNNQYKYIFSGLERLEDGDLIYVNYQSVRYTYRVYKKEVVEPSNVAALVVQTDKPLITLVTCTPLGTSRYRLLVTGEQISPSYENAEQPETVVVDDTAEMLPSNEPSFFERIWNWLTGQ